MKGVFMNLEEGKAKLEKYGQGHIWLAYERLDAEGKKKLWEQIERLDFEKCLSLYELTKKQETYQLPHLEPIKATDAKKLSSEEKENFEKIGSQIIREGKYAIVMMAGGQGTRLGHSGPKGTYDFGLASHKSIFEVFADKLKEAKQTYGVTIPWYIMTSKANHQETEDFFKEHQYFDYEDGVKMFFNQNELPMLDENGKIIIDENNLIKEAANGHGGVYEALVDNGALEEMKKAGIEWIFICGVDNVLVPLADPLLIGFSSKNQNKITSISCIKADPNEKVGILCKKENRPSVVEYTEMPEHYKNLVDENGELVFGESHILMNLFHISVISDIAKKKLDYHVAFKKSDYRNEKGELIIATEPNAYKFETFLFDAFERVDKLGILRYKREECFAPIKNATGKDSPETARKLYQDYYGIK